MLLALHFSKRLKCAVLCQACLILCLYSSYSLNLLIPMPARRSSRWVSVCVGGDAFDDLDVLLQPSRIVLAVPGNPIVRF